MTGFATAQLEWQLSTGATVPIALTIRVLNSRFFETVFRMPQVLASLEQPMMHSSKAAFKRGNVTVTAHLGSSLALRGLIMPSVETVQQQVRALRILKDACNIAQDVTLGDLVRLPHLFETVEEPVSADFSAYLLQQFERLITEVVAGRQREGTSLKGDLITLMQAVGKALEELAPRADLISRERRERFLAGIMAAIAPASADVQQQHIQTLYQNLNTIDIHEEIIRFRAHHQNFLATLEDCDIQKGKKLDFILQELFREINTLNAKLADVHSIAAVLTIKTKLEQAREQVQNIV